MPSSCGWSRRWIVESKSPNPDRPISEGMSALIRSLHEQFTRGEMSQGYLAEQLGMGRRAAIPRPAPLPAFS